MWLLPVFPPIASLTARLYYRLTVAGLPVPATGPALLVSNHPNSLLDPVLVIAAAGRPVRFLAKSPLFSDQKVGWLVRGSGAIPVYRKVDDPAKTERNVETFSAVHSALANAAAVGIFPEGLSHSEPSMAPLKTGAARIALGAARKIGASFPIVPMGLVFREKDVFRSEALVVVGRPIAWADLAVRGDADFEAVRELTDRLDRGLRRVTINLNSWTDGPIVECALAVWESEFGAAPDAEARVRRLETTTTILERVQEGSKDTSIAEAVVAHARRLKRLRLTPSDLAADVRATTAVRWSARRLFLISVPAVLVAVVSFLFFWLPYQATGRIVAAMHPDIDQRSTHKLLVGIAAYGLWIGGLSALTGIWLGLTAAALLVVAAPVVGVFGLRIRERWRGAWADARRFFLLRSRGSLLDELRHRQQHLAQRLDAVYRRQLESQETAS